MFDIDHFKSINDTFGHRSGDDALRGVANLIADAARTHGGTATRLGGEEFALVLPGRTTAQTAEIAERILDGVRALRIPAADDQIITLTSSAGVTSAGTRAGLGHMHVDGGASGVSDALAAADSYLYKAKATNRDRVVSDLTTFP
jgi:diguanylate cyclase (GGDEF)-like protein